MRTTLAISLFIAFAAFTSANASTIVLSSDFATHDTDGDGVPDLGDNAPNIANALQEDSDGDGAGDVRDQGFGNPDNDGDGFGQEYDPDDSDSLYWSIEGVIGGFQTIGLGDTAAVALSLEMGDTIPFQTLTSSAPVIENYILLGLWVDDVTASGSPDAWWIGTVFETSIDFSAADLAALGFTVGIHDVTTQVDFLGFGGGTHTTQIEVVPEPGTGVLAMAGLAGLGVWRRSRRGR